MICFIYGSNKDKLLAKTGELLKILKEKRPDAEAFEMRSDEWGGGNAENIGRHLDSYISSQGLFEKKLIITLKNLCSESEEAKEYIFDRLTDMEKSENVFVIVEEKLDAKSLGQIKKTAKKVVEAGSDKADMESGGKYGKAAGFNVFALGDAFGERNRGKAWSVYQKALMNGSEPEELHGLIFWQLKSMLLAGASETAEEAGQKPFVFSKSKRFAKNYREGELQEISGKMVRLYHESRLESRSLDIALEKFLLEI